MAIWQTIALYLTLTDAQITSKSDLENLVIINNGKDYTKRYCNGSD
jgi:hypothetical protein